MAKPMSSKSLREARERQRKLKKLDKKRKENTRLVHLNYLIVCEGEKTEPNYFRALVKGRNSRVYDAQVEGEGECTCRLVETALSLCERSTMHFDRVWVVFDKDDFADFNQAIELAHKYEMNAAWSNESFEIWYYLHFQYLDTGVTRAQYIDMLEREIAKYIEGYKYEKNSLDTYNILHTYGNEAFASANARRLLKNYSGANYAEHKPCTMVFALVDELNNPEEVLRKLNEKQSADKNI